jgi:hypothetical protein
MKILEFFASSRKPSLEISGFGLLLLSIRSLPASHSAADILDATSAPRRPTAQVMAYKDCGRMLRRDANPKNERKPCTASFVG